jgi:hypothetical protein
MTDATVTDLRDHVLAEPCRCCGHALDEHLGFTADQDPLTMTLDELLDEATPGPCRACWREGRRCCWRDHGEAADDFVITLAPERPPATVTPLSPATRTRKGGTS